MKPSLRLTIIFSILVCSRAASASSEAFLAQDPARKIPEQGDEAGNSLDPEFDAVWKQYVSAVRDRDEQRLNLARSGRTDTSPHPAIRYFKRFKELADKDHPDAQCWVIDNLYLATTDKEEQKRLYRETYAELIPKHADFDAVYRAIGGLRRASDVLGETETAAMLQKIVDTSTNAEVRAAALYGVAWLKSEKGKTTDPKRKAEAREIHKQIVLAFPRTKTAKEVSGYLLNDAEAAFLDAERKWVRDVEQLVAAKKPISEWPKQPIHDFEREFQPIAEAGNMLAKQWVRFLYPDYQIIEKQGPEIALTSLVASLGQRYPNDFGGWMNVRVDMLRVLYLQFPTSSAPWLTASLAQLSREAPWIPYPMVENTLKPLVDQSSDSKVRALTLFTLSQSMMRSDDPESNKRVHELLTEIVEKHSDEDVAREARDVLTSLDAVSPGAEAPDFFVYDSMRVPLHLSDYRGRATMLIFFSMDDEACVKAFPAQLELMKKLENRPFSVLGIDIDSPDSKRYQEHASKRGITWRTVLVYLPKDELVVKWRVRSYPTAILIDDEGKIRARNAPWDEMVKMAEKLTVDAEAKATKNAPKK